MGYQLIKLAQLNEQLYEVTINRSNVKNALNEQVIQELTDVLQQLEQIQARVVILKGAQSNFAAGADIKMMESAPVEVIEQFCALIGQLHNAIKRSSIIWIAAIEGYCLGGGLELALATDIRVVSEKATLGFPEVKLALLPGGGGTQRFLKLAGSAFANHYILTGEHFTASKALEMGLVSEVVSDVNRSALKTAEKIIRHDITATTAIKQLISSIENDEIQQGLQKERENFVGLFSEGKARLGIKKFLESRV